MSNVSKPALQTNEPLAMQPVATVSTGSTRGSRWTVWAFAFGVLFMALGAITLVASIIAVNIPGIIISGLITAVSILIVKKNANWADM